MVPCDVGEHWGGVGTTMMVGPTLQFVDGSRMGGAGLVSHVMTTTGVV